MSGCPRLGWLGRSGGMTVKRHRVSCWGDESVLKLAVIVRQNFFERLTQMGFMLSFVMKIKPFLT